MISSAKFGRGAAVLAAALGLACGDEAPAPEQSAPNEPQSVVADLVDRFRLASFDVDAPEIDLGTDASHPFLVSGWSFDEIGDTGNPFVWSVGESSRLHFHLGRVRPIRLHFRCYPFPAASGPPQKLSVVLNGHFLDMITLAPLNQDYELALPPDALVTGRNTLEFHYAITYDPSQELAGVIDQRQLGVLWHWIRIGEEYSLPSADPEERSLSIPLLHRLRYSIRAPARAALRIAGIEAPKGASLDVTATYPDGERHELGRLQPGEGELRLTLPAREADFVELALEAVPAEDGTVAVGELTLREPIVEAPAAAPENLARRPNIVLYVIDTLRRDQLGIHGSSGPVSPSIDAFADEARVFEDARAVSSWTRPTAASLLTGLLPSTHGVTGTSSKLASEAITLAEILRAVGYETAAFSMNVNVTPPFGFDQGFRIFDDLIREFNLKILHEVHATRSRHPKADIVHEKVFEYLLGGRRRSPFFLYVHTMDPHAPYIPNPAYQAASEAGEVDPELGSLDSLAELQEGRREPTDERIARIRSLYAGEVARNDEMFGALMSELRHLRLYEDSLIVVVSDHGEGFLEHGFMGHANNLFDEALRIPMIVKLPGSSAPGGRRLSVPISQVDLMPTLLGYLGITLREPVDGRNLSQVFASEEAAPDRPRIAHLDMPPFQARSVVDGALKLILRTNSGDEREIAELYDLASDPEERHDRSEERPGEVARLRKFLESEETGPRWSVPIEPLGPMEDRLRALGYVE